jgi:hypothetical protein
MGPHLIPGSIPDVAHLSGQFTGGLQGMFCELLFLGIRKIRKSQTNISFRDPPGASAQ